MRRMRRNLALRRSGGPVRGYIPGATGAFDQAHAACAFLDKPSVLAVPERPLSRISGNTGGGIECAPVRPRLAVRRPFDPEPRVVEGKLRRLDDGLRLLSARRHGARHRRLAGPALPRLSPSR